MSAVSRHIRAFDIGTGSSGIAGRKGLELWDAVKKGEPVPVEVIREARLQSGTPAAWKQRRESLRTPN